MSQYLQAFLIGGTVISLAKYVSQYFGPLYASIIGGFPTGILTSFFLLQTAQKEYFHSYAYHSVVLALTIVCIYLINVNTQLNPFLVSAIGITFWAVVSLIIVRFFLST